MQTKDKKFLFGLTLLMIGVYQIYKDDTYTRMIGAFVCIIGGVFINKHIE